MAIEKRTGKRGTTYHFRVLVGKDQNGKQIFKRMIYKPTNTAPSKIEKEVQQAHAQFEREVQTGQFYDDKLTFSQFYKTWLKEYGYKQLSPAEYEANQYNVNRIFIPELGHLPMKQIKGLHIQSVINKLENRGMKPQSIQKVFTQLRTIFTRAYKLELIADNPCSRVTLPRNEDDGEIHFFTVPQALTFLNAVKSGITVHHEAITRKNGRIIPAYDEHMEIPFQFLVYFTVAIHSGFRRGEMVGLRWENVDFQKGLITVDHATSQAKAMNGQFDKDPKSKAGFRTISLPSDCFSLLEQLQQEQNRIADDMGDAWQGERLPELRYIFTQANGTQMHLSTPTHKFREILLAYNSSVKESDQLPLINLHDLRHTSASILISAGVDCATVARRLGHSKISMTLDRYTHALPNIDQTASDVLSQAFTTASAGKNEGHSRVTNLRNVTNCDPKPEKAGINYSA